MGYQERKRDFHEARWDEPIIMELGSPGERGVLVPKADPRVAKATGTVEDLLPAGLKRKKAPKLPEMSQMQVLRHYMRLSQETIGTDINIDIGLGTCTMKYSPKVNEQLVRSEKLQELHPCQDESTVQGILEIMYREAEYLKAISGMAKSASSLPAEPRPSSPMWRPSGLTMRPGEKGSREMRSSPPSCPIPGIRGQRPHWDTR